MGKFIYTMENSTAYTLPTREPMPEWRKEEIIAEYGLIKQKKSKLSRRERDKIEFYIKKWERK